MSKPAEQHTDAGKAEAPATERVAERAHEAVDKAAGRLGAQEIRLREGAAAVDEHARTAADRLRSGAGVEGVVEYVRDNPLKSLAAAFAAGYVLSILRR